MCNSIADWVTALFYFICFGEGTIVSVARVLLGLTGFPKSNNIKAVNRNLALELRSLLHVQDIFEKTMMMSPLTDTIENIPV